MKFLSLALELIFLSRSREGAWIEIYRAMNDFKREDVAPVRERGLKCQIRQDSIKQSRRSREGAWIEIPLIISNTPIISRSREGAWIEMRCKELSAGKLSSLP